MGRVKFLLALRGNLSSPSLGRGGEEDSSGDTKQPYCHVTDDGGATLKYESAGSPLNSYCQREWFKVGGGA